MKIRNFSIISHIDHGKSTLADRFLELTETVASRDMEDRFLDNMDLEKERGITIKLQPARMKWKDFVLNMIDTPGHIDFSYEVSRSLKAVEGAILLVDATKGVQAQTITTLEMAKKQDLKLIPAINKIDLPSAKIEETAKEIMSIIDIEREEIIEISAKEGTNVEKLLDALIEKVPPPEEKDGDFKSLIFDFERDPYKGVVAFIRVFQGEIRKGEDIELVAVEEDGEVKELGFFNPKLQPKKKLSCGEIGYIATGIKEVDKVRVGDTIRKAKTKVRGLPGYKEPKPVVFTSFYPKNSRQFPEFKKALEEVRLSDPAFSFTPEFKEVFGRGFRCGFLGSLHVEIISQRLQKEYGLDLIISTPSVSYKVKLTNGEEEIIKTATDFPDRSKIEKVLEPWALLEIVTPQEYIGGVNKVLEGLKGNYLDTDYFSSSNRLVINYEAPFRKVITGFYDSLKSVSKGYGSFGYEIAEYRPGDLGKMEILLNKEPEEAFSKIVSRDEAESEGRKLAKRLKELLPPQQFPVPIQAKIDGRIIARETIKARRKDVTGDLYGGDRTRKDKLLQQQKEGKKRMKRNGSVDVPQEVFFKVFKDND
jgi:GTP-binding protein LepA